MFLEAASAASIASAAPRGAPGAPPQPLAQDAAVRAIKLADIGWATASYFGLALLTVFCLSRVMGAYDAAKEARKSTVRIVLEIVLHVWVIGALAYVARNLFQLVPWPLEGVFGYQHLRVKEVSNSAIFVALVVAFDSHLISQVSELKRRMGIPPMPAVQAAAAGSGR